MAAPDRVAGAPGGGAQSPPPEWRRLKYPDEETYIRVQQEHPTTFGRTYWDLHPAIRLGWPSVELWERVNAAKPEVAKQLWASLQERYPDRAGVAPDQQDLPRMARFWPDCLGEPMVEVDLALKEGITINTLTYGPGVHRVPRPVAVDLRYIDSQARQAFIDQFIPRIHQDRVLATLSAKGGGSEGQIS